jgi:TIR domain
VKHGSEGLIMKVFISHSSRDKWIARRISQDLISFGIETFLDEKDIETGTPLDEAIGEHLKDCDDCLMLLSPTALKSHWVLLEIGGAKALGKRLVPVLLHVGANELPLPISRYLARDINDIEKYYDEIRQRLAGQKVTRKQPKAPRKTQTTRKKRKSFSIGDRVKIVVSRDEAAKREDLSWVYKMDAYCGKSATITGFFDLIERAAFLDIDKGRFAWAFEWLTKE